MEEMTRRGVGSPPGLRLCGGWRLSGRRANLSGRHNWTRRPHGWNRPGRWEDIRTGDHHRQQQVQPRRPQSRGIGNRLPINAGQAVMRNILRSADALPSLPVLPQIYFGFYIVGLLTSVMNNRYQRLGDLIAQKDA